MEGSSPLMGAGISGKQRDGNANNVWPVRRDVKVGLPPGGFSRFHSHLPVPHSLTLLKLFASFWLLYPPLFLTVCLKLGDEPHFS